MRLFSKKNLSPQRLTALIFLLTLIFPVLYTVTALDNIVKVGNGFINHQFPLFTFKEAYAKAQQRDFRGIRRMTARTPELAENIRTIRDAFNGDALRYRCIDYYGLIQKILQKNYITLYRLKGGSLTGVFPINNDSLDKKDGIVEMSKILKQKNTPFLYVQAPHKNCKYQNSFYRGSEHDYCNEQVDLFISEIAKEGVPYLDLREKLHQEGKDHLSMFFKTDHHWTPESGFWAFCKIANCLQDKFNISFDPFYQDINNYNINILPHQSLGSFGKNLGIYYAPPEDFSIITPKFDTNIRTEWLIYPDEPVREGKIETAFLMPQHLKKNYYQNATYNYYSANEESFKLTNLNAPNSLKILFIRDSFGGVVAPFLALSCSQLTIFDVREKKEKLDQLLKEEDFDVVIELLNPDVL